MYVHWCVPSFRPNRYDGSVSKFTNAFYSFLTCFQIVTLDDWPFLAQHLYNSFPSAPAVGVVLVVVVTVIGNYVVMQLVTAVILVTFDEVRFLRHVDPRCQPVHVFVGFIA